MKLIVDIVLKFYKYDVNIDVNILYPIDNRCQKLATVLAAAAAAMKLVWPNHPCYSKFDELNKKNAIFCAHNGRNN